VLDCADEFWSMKAARIGVCLRWRRDVGRFFQPVINQALRSVDCVEDYVRPLSKLFCKLLGG
jgi:hypothetical protein